MIVRHTESLRLIPPLDIDRVTHPSEFVKRRVPIRIEAYEKDAPEWTLTRSPENTPFWGNRESSQYPILVTLL